MPDNHGRQFLISFILPSVLHYTHLQVFDDYIVCEVHFPRSMAIKSSGSERVKWRVPGLHISHKNW